MALGSMSFTAMVGFVKAVRSDLSTVEVIFWRGAVAVVLLFLFARPPGFRLGNPKLFLVRLTLGFAAMACFYGAARGLALTDLTLISKLQPIFIAVGAPLALGSGERTGPALWVVLALGLGGIALILGPELAVGSWYGLAALGGAVASSGAHLALRGLGGTESTRTVVFWFQGGLVVMALAILTATGNPPELPERSLWLPLAMVGATATAGQLLMTRAYAVERAAVVAAAGYTSPLWAVLGDVLFFGVRPGWQALAGGGLVILAGLWLVRDR
jgi:drug/metabolite transporter (DMT)-like permease